MAKIKAEGDRWAVRLGQDRRRAGVRVVLFFCETTDQRPYRVVEVPEEKIDSQDDIEALGTDELMALFEKSTSLDAPVLRSDEVTDVRTRDAIRREKPPAP